MTNLKLVQAGTPVGCHVAVEPCQADATATENIGALDQAVGALCLVHAEGGQGEGDAAAVRLESAWVRYPVNDPSSYVGDQLQPGVASPADGAGGELCPALSTRHVPTRAAEHRHGADSSQAHRARHQGLQVVDKTTFRVLSMYL